MQQNVKRAAPAWLGLSPDRTSFIFIPERAEVVREIFQLNISGFGGRAIAQYLNAKKVPVFASAALWDQSTIHNILSNPATFGEYQKKQKVGGRKQLVGEPISHYYPPVITRSTFEAAQSARKHHIEVRSGRRGDEITNLFFGVHLECLYCEQPVKFLSKSHENRMACNAVDSKDGTCSRFAWTYTDFEATFFSCLLAGKRYPDLIRMLESLRTANIEGGKEDRLELRTHIAVSLRETVGRVTIASAGLEPPPPKPHLLIRRDHPARFFKVQFRDGFSADGYPKKNEPTGPRIDSAKLEERFSLSPRQSQITSLLVQGFTLQEVAEGLSQTLETARWHLREIFRRTSTHSQAELIELAQHVCSE